MLISCDLAFSVSNGYRVEINSDFEPTPCWESRDDDMSMIIVGRLSDCLVCHDMRKI